MPRVIEAIHGKGNIKRTSLMVGDEYIERKREAPRKVFISEIDETPNAIYLHLEDEVTSKSLVMGATAFLSSFRKRGRD